MQYPTFLGRYSGSARSTVTFHSPAVTHLVTLGPYCQCEREGHVVLEKILVPLDGSPLAEAALPYAKAIASRAGASLVLVRAAHHTSFFGDGAVDQQRAISQAEDYLTLLADGLTTEGFLVQTGVPFGGSPAEWIVEESEIRHVDLIVMATHDRIGPDRWVRGSVAEAVVHRSTVPVMLVRATDAGQLARRFEAEQPVLIVPLDGSDVAESALPIARELAQAIGARVVVAGVVPKPGQFVAGQAGAIVTYAGSEHAQLVADAWAYLESSAGGLGTMVTSVETVVRYGDAAVEVAAVAREYAAAAVVMATHGRTGLVRSILGSVAGGVLHHSTCPVVLSSWPGSSSPATEQALVSGKAYPVG
jgi:nucleotide-binding universal stress UspA family protein